MSQLSPVQFYEDTIFCVTYENEPYTPMRPIIENMGLNWKTQYRKLMSSKERWGVVKMTTPSNSGLQETVCIPVKKLAAFLATINPNAVRAEIRPRLTRYQNECDDVLNQYWTGQRIRPEQKSPAPQEAPKRTYRKAERPALPLKPARDYRGEVAALWSRLADLHARFYREFDGLRHDAAMLTGEITAEHGLRYPAGHAVRPVVWRLTMQGMDKAVMYPAEYLPSYENPFELLEGFAAEIAERR